MKITFRNGFEIRNSELEKKSIEELYDLHRDLVADYTHYNDKGVLDKLETYIEMRAEEEIEFDALAV